VVVAVVIIIAFVLVIVVVIVLQKKKTAAAKDADLITGASAPPGTDPPAQMAEMVVIIPSAAAAPAEEEAAAEQIANECAAKYPLIKVDLAHGHLITLKSLKFLPNSADPEEPELFEALLQQLGACMILANDPPYERDIHLVIGGHTDCPKEKATTSYFINLSNKRAESVKAHLMMMHPELDASHLYPKGYGGARPIPGAIVGEGDRPNMRITFETTVASTVGAIIAVEVVYEGLE
jgi:outer membrane protein OmpA-like peptidoglycan-associated protein